MSDDLVWIDRKVSRTWHRMWQTPLGMHYEALYPRDFADKEVMQRVETVTSGTVYGAHPDLGTVTIRSWEPSATTEVTLPPEYGPWVETSPQN